MAQSSLEVEFLGTGLTRSASKGKRNHHDTQEKTEFVIARSQQDFTMTDFCSRVLVFAFGWLLFQAGVADARIEPSFQLEQATWNATHIVVVESDRKREGAFRVVESWKGDLELQSVAPDIQVLLPEGQRTIYDAAIGAARDREPKRVTDLRRVFFLVRKSDSEGNVAWESAASAGAGDRAYNYLPVSMVWIEDGRAFAIQQWKNPGPARMHPLRAFTEKEPSHEDMDEAQVKKEVDRLVAIQTQLQTAMKIEDATERAKVQSKSWNAWHEGFPALCKCGRPAVFPLCELLKDESLISRHGEITKALARFGSRDASVAMVGVIKEELVFWKKHAPDLPEGWRGGTNTLPNVAESTQQHHLRLIDALEFLARHPTPSATKPVQELRDYWLSLPQLDGKGRKHISTLCDRVLNASDKPSESKTRSED